MKNLIIIILLLLPLNLYSQTLDVVRYNLAVQSKSQPNVKAVAPETIFNKRYTESTKYWDLYRTSTIRTIEMKSYTVFDQYGVFQRQRSHSIQVKNQKVTPIQFRLWRN